MELHRYLLPLAIVLGLSACSEKKAPEIPDVFAVFPVIIMPPGGSFVSKSGSKDALALRLRTPAKADAAANFYRAALRPPAWRLVSDSKDNQGATLLYAEHSGRPLWVRIWPDSEFNATFVELTGAVQTLHPDSTKAPGDSEAAAALLPKPAATLVPMAPPRTAPGK
jgi:hypothetical protein